MTESPLDFTEKLIRAAGTMLRGYYQNADLLTSIKADKSVITEADEIVDRFIGEQIHLYYPNEWILSEEVNPILSELDSQTQTSAGWIVDPIDGTTNFSLGLPVWGILCTRVVKGWPQLTAMYFPIIDELYTAVAGGGAWLNGQQIQVESAWLLNRKSFFACCTRTHRLYEVSIPYKVRILGSSAYTFCLVARGVARIGFDATPKIWDIAGAWLLVKEAGGIIESFSGESPFPLVPDTGFSSKSYPTLAATTTDQLAKARDQIQIKPNTAA